MNTGYYHCPLSKDGVLTRYYVHHIVALTFLGYVKKGRKVVINHIDGNPSNNHLSNLEIVSQSYNVKQSFKNGRVIYNRCDVYVYDKNMAFVGKYKGTYHAAKELNMSTDKITYAMNKQKNNFSCGLYFYRNLKT